MNSLLDRFDTWINDGSNVAALTLRQWLEPVEGEDAVVFPPTYPLDSNKPGYNIDPTGSNGENVCQIDSVGSQANRMEPLFLRPPYSDLIPKVIIKTTTDGKERIVDILEAGHRAADAIVRFSSLGPQLHEAFESIKNSGDATPLALIAPTSLVFGVWDSRSTQIKLPRVVRSVIRAFNVRELHRSAQYTTIAGEVLEGPDVEITTKGVKAELGLAHVPAVMTHGGVQAMGGLRQEAALNLVAIRSLAAAVDQPDKTIALRRYILGLSLVALTAPQDLSLREGCQLVPSLKRPAEWKLVRHDGNREGFTLSHEDALEYAVEAARAFGPGSALTGEFNSTLANQVQSLSEKDRKALLRQGPVTATAIEKLRVKANTKRNNKPEAGGEGGSV